MKYLVVFFAFACVLFIYQYPNIAPFSNVPNDYVYLGQNSYFDPWDVNLYVSAIRYGQNGELLLPNLYTSLPNQPVAIYSVLTSIGFMFKSVNPFLVFHVSSLATGVILLIGMFFLILKLKFSFYKALFLTFLISLSGGFGFLFQKTQIADISNSAFTFYSTFQKAHEAIGVGGYLFALTFAYFFFEERKIQYVVISCASLLLTALIYPYFIAVFLLTTAFYYFFSGRKKGDFWIFIISIPSILVAVFSAGQFLINPTFGNVGANLSTDIVQFLLGYGVLIPLFVYLLFQKKRSNLTIFLSLWFLVTFFLSLVPFGPGKIFLRGSFFPLVILGLLSLELLVRKYKKLDPAVFYTVFVVFLVGTSFFIFYSRISNSYTKNPWTYMDMKDYRIFETLNRYTQKDSTVLTFYRLSNQIPAFTHNRVYFGHFLQTPDADSTLRQAATFVGDNGLIEDKRKFIKSKNVNFIIWGDEEKALLTSKNNKNNEVVKYLESIEKIGDAGQFEIYKTK